MIKGTVASDFVGTSLACMDRSEREKEPLLVFNFFCCHFKLLKLLIPKHLEESPTLIYKCRQQFEKISCIHLREMLTRFKFV